MYPQSSRWYFYSVQASSPTTFPIKEKKEDYFKLPCRVLTTLSTKTSPIKKEG
jgi:hypothetical protein